MIGQMTERLRLMRKVTSPDGGGGTRVTYASMGEVAALAEARPARNVTRAEQAFTVRRARFVLRHREDIGFDERLEHRGRTYRPTDIQADRDRRFLTLDAEEVAP